MKYSLRKAINAMCKHCIYDEKSGQGNWRQQVAACTSSNCPLHPVRPTSKPRAENRKQSPKNGVDGAGADI